MDAVRDLHQILKSLRPEVRQGEFVFVSVAPTQVHELPYEAVVKENEGTTVVLRKQAADDAGLSYDYVAGWITLTVHSALDSVGLTAAFATALAAAGISCNVLAGLHHDHLLVASSQTPAALKVLEKLARS